MWLFILGVFLGSILGLIVAGLLGAAHKGEMND